jgi:hypothetical protein
MRAIGSSRRRSLVHPGMLLLVIGASCAPASPSGYVDGVCRPTRPDPTVSPPAAITTDRASSWHGNDVLWLVLPADGVVRYSGTKIPAYRAAGASGVIAIQARRLDGPTSPVATADVARFYGDTGFTPTGLTFATAGCWEVTYALGGRDLRFVLDVRGEAPPTQP